MGQENEQEKTFAEAEGLPANAHAKKLAKEKSKKKKVEQGVFYTQKGDKVVKMIVKPGRVFTVYIGNLKRHKDGLAGPIKEWQAQGAWVKPHEIEQKIAELKKQLEAKK